MGKAKPKAAASKAKGAGGVPGGAILAAVLVVAVAAAMGLLFPWGVAAPEAPPEPFHSRVEVSNTRRHGRTLVTFTAEAHDDASGLQNLLLVAVAGLGLTLHDATLRVDARRGRVNNILTVTTHAGAQVSAPSARGVEP